ncbi:hypothetical protein AHGSH82_019500 [Aeromonas hydrophila]|nr:hypothetical protein AHGSH82_019500 [Aeromonas hydrophila]
MLSAINRTPPAGDKLGGVMGAQAGTSTDDSKGQS